MQICCICVLPFLILAIAKGFLLRLIKERVDPYKDWGPFLISCGIYQTCQSLEKGSLKEVTDWPPHHFYQAWKMSPDPHCFHAKTHDLTLFSFYWISYHHHISTPCIFLFLGAPLGYENIPTKWKEKSVNNKKSLSSKSFFMCERGSLFFHSKLNSTKKDREGSWLIVPKHPLGNQLNKKVVVWMTSQLYKWWKN